MKRENRKRVLLRKDNSNYTIVLFITLYNLTHEITQQTFFSVYVKHTCLFIYV